MYYSLQYHTTNDTIRLCYKVDIKHAFRLCPIHPFDRHILGIQLWAQICTNYLQHAGWWHPINSWTPLRYPHHIPLPWCFFFAVHLQTPSAPTPRTGCWPSVLSKVEGPTTLMTFLGIQLDASAQQARLPQVKLQQIIAELKDFTQKHAFTRQPLHTFPSSQGISKPLNQSILYHHTTSLPTGRPSLTSFLGGCRVSKFTSLPLLPPVIKHHCVSNSNSLAGTNLCLFFFIAMCLPFTGNLGGAPFNQ